VLVFTIFGQSISRNRQENKFNPTWTQNNHFTDLASGRGTYSESEGKDKFTDHVRLYLALPKLQNMVIESSRTFVATMVDTFPIT